MRRWALAAALLAASAMASAAGGGQTLLVAARIHTMQAGRPEAGALVYDANNPRLRPVSDFELGQVGEGDVK